MKDEHEARAELPALVFAGLAAVLAGLSAFLVSRYGFLWIGHSGRGVINGVATLCGILLPLPFAFSAARAARRKLLSRPAPEDDDAS